MERERKAKPSLLWKSNTRGMLEVWRWQGDSLCSPYPGCSHVRVGQGDCPSLLQAEGRKVGWWVWQLAGCSLPIASAAFMHGFLAASVRASCYPLAFHRRWLDHTWKGFQGRVALQAFSCHVGVKPWTLLGYSITLMNSRQAGCIWLGMFLWQF